ncbi:hypothetical protein GGR54DRAFT_638657 [Hypoxylon sp. NC1633]|nr:hypothetical protein GGR54DRAFT_638657 [Hypoxylon sp. NC1633]
MGPPPAYIFIVRHGKRLDAADKQWHLSSPTPYDPPLTYGGWLQSKTVGSKIASILREREAEDEAAASGQGPDKTPTKLRKRRYKVVIHSSPFQRCVQTSIAIAAGLASNHYSPSHTPVERSPSPRSTQISPPGHVHSRPHPASATQTSLSPDSSAPSAIEKSILRVDPFLGEWLSPDYFEHITPPPRSSLMLATAKAELLRRENYNDYPHFHTRHPPTGSLQLWSASPSRGSPLASSMTPDSDTSAGLGSLSALKTGLPRTRGDLTEDPRGAHRVPHFETIRTSGYVSPVPSYALSTSEPIPRGYVAHARDACVDIDYQWDSSRENLGWGDGGVLPEEWAAMHQRFRKGLRRLVEWYSTTENPGEMVTRTNSSLESVKYSRKESAPGSLPVGDDKEVETENVVVLVSHGAGCNALIGAITQQPVLIDVGMSSITMAQRKPEFDYGFDASVYDGAATSLEEPLITTRAILAEMFELKLFANTEHLHSAATPPSLSRSASAAGRNPRGRNNNRFSSALKEANFGASLYGDPVPGSRSNSVNASLGSMRRGSPVTPSSVWAPPSSRGGGGTVAVDSAVSSSPSTQPIRSGSGGLWTPPVQDDVADIKEEIPSRPALNHEGEPSKSNHQDFLKAQEHDSVPGDIELQTSAMSSAKTPASKTGSHHSEERDHFDEGSVPRLWASTVNNGLWGAPRPPGEAERNRDFRVSKRRWTVNER